MGSEKQMGLGADITETLSPLLGKLYFSKEMLYGYGVEPSEHKVYRFVITSPGGGVVVEQRFTVHPKEKPWRITPTWPLPQILSFAQAFVGAEPEMQDLITHQEKLKRLEFDQNEAVSELRASIRAIQVQALPGYLRQFEWDILKVDERGVTLGAHSGDAFRPLSVRLGKLLGLTYHDSFQAGDMEVRTDDGDISLFFSSMEAFAKFRDEHKIRVIYVSLKSLCRELQINSEKALQAKVQATALLENMKASYPAGGWRNGLSESGLLISDRSGHE